MKKGSRQVSCERIWFTFPRGKVKLQFRDRRQDELSPFSGQLARSSECFESDRRPQNFQALEILFSVTATDVLFITRLTQSLRPHGFFLFFFFIERISRGRLPYLQYISHIHVDKTTVW